MDKKYMEAALKQAKIALKHEEVPVGAVIVRNNKIIARGYNKKETKKNSLLHAELIAIDRACKKIGAWRLDDCVLYTTLFPCPMCASAIQQSRIKKIYYLDNSNDLEAVKISKKILNNNKRVVQIQKIDLETNILTGFFYKIRNRKQRINRMMDFE